MSGGRITVGHPVDVGSGAVYTLSTDFRIPGSLPISWRRHYSTLATRDAWLGIKWSVPYFMTLERRGDRYILDGAHGEQVSFGPAPEELCPGEVLPNFGANMELRLEGDHYTVLHWHNNRNIVRFGFRARSNAPMALAWIENLAGHRVRVEYDSDNRPSRIFQELERRTIEIDYGRADLIAALYFSGQAGRKLLVRYEYDGGGRLTAAIDAKGYRKEYEYDGQDRMVSEINPLGSRFIFKYDRLGRCTYTTGDDGFMERKLQYVAAPPMTRVIDSRGALTEYHLNPAGQVVQIVNPGGGVISKTFDEYGRLTSVTRPDGSKETHEYDDKGNRVASVDPNGAKSTTEHDDLHMPIGMVDRNGNAWKLPNKPEGSLAGVENLPRRQWDYRWDSRGLVTEAQSAGGWKVQVRHDEQFRWHENRDQLSLLSRTEFDELGYVIQTVDAEGTVSGTRYDEVHNPIEKSRGDSGVTRFRWNGLGKMTERIGPGKQHEIREYDWFGHLVARTNSMGGTVRFEYDKEGKLTSITNRVGERLEYRRDLEGRIVEEKLFDGRVQKYEYDVSGRRVVVHLSDGRSVRQKFDPADRLISRKSSDGLVDQFAYDKHGRMIKAWNGHAEVELKRDRYGRIVAEVQNGRSVKYRYDAEGNRIGRSLPLAAAGGKLKRVFDRRGRLLQIQDERGPCQEFRWDNLNRMIERRCPGGVLERRLYDNQGRLHEQHVQGTGSRMARIHTYDASGNLAALENSLTGTTRFSYDGLDRLKEVRRGNAVVEAYDYDANHAMLGTHRGSRDVAAGGRVIRDELREISHGPDGAVAAVRAGESSWSFKHDVNGRLVEAVDPNGVVINYEYDPFGRRTAKIIGEERTEFLWEGWALAAEVRDSSAEAVYVFTDLRPLAQWNASQRLTPVLDHRGAVQEVFDETGRRRWNCALDAYGNILSEKGDTPNPFRLRGQYHDTETGLHYNFHRHYDPAVGDFTAPDPIGIAGGHHFYAYPRNPLRWDDPFGLECGDPDKHEDDPAEDDPSASKPGKGPAPLEDPPEEAPPGKPLSKDEAFDKAAGVRDERLEELDGLSNNQRKKIATVVGACDPATGETGLGVKVDGQDYGNCAEDLARADLASKTDSDPNTFVYSPAVRPRTDEVIPVCTRCQDRGITPDHVPPGTPFEPRPAPAASGSDPAPADPAPAPADPAPAPATPAPTPKPTGEE